MARTPFARKHTLWMSIVATVLGLAFTILAYLADYGAANWTDFYESWVPEDGPGGNWNMLARVAGPIVLLMGAWYLGEQIMARRKFNELIETEKKSEFRKNVSELEETAKKLPKRYEKRLEKKSETFTSRR